MRYSSTLDYGFHQTANALTKLPLKVVAGAGSLAFVAGTGALLANAIDPARDLIDAAPIEASASMSAATTIADKTSLELFDEVADNRRIPFERTTTGCFQRAEQMRRQLEQKGLKVLKIWAFQKGNQVLKFQSPNPNEGTQKWTYHVAVALPIASSLGRPKIYVFDPTVFNGPAEITEWAQKINADPKTIQLTDPDILPARYRAVKGWENDIYTKDGYTSLIKKEIGNYFNAGEQRKVFPSEFRSAMCARFKDARSCTLRGQTWVAAPPAPKVKAGYSLSYFFS